MAERKKSKAALPRATRDAILSSQDMQREDVEVPEWGCVVTVQGITARQRSELERMMAASTGGSGNAGKADFAAFYAALVQMSVVDPDTGKPLFDPRDRDTLLAKSAGAFNRVSRVAARLSGMGTEGLDAALKGSDEAQSGESTSD